MNKRNIGAVFRIRVCSLICRLLLLLFPASHLLCQNFSSAAGPTLLLWDTTATGADSVNQCSFKRMLESAGYTPIRILRLEEVADTIPARSMFVAPCGAARRLSPDLVQRVAVRLSDGLTLITDGDNPLTRELGFVPGPPVRVSGIVDAYRPDVHPFWSDTPSVQWFSDFPRLHSTIVYRDNMAWHPLGIILQKGAGRCLLLAPLFDPTTGRGYRRFASLPLVIAAGLHRTPSFIRRGADAYFDAGFRPGIPPDSLARMWRSWGIRAIHAAAWYIYSSPPYDYSALVEALHRNGILAYAWLEWPYIGKGFWDSHPKWRQKNALQKDAHLDFLYLMDLQNPECMNTALADLEQLLRLDWDGVDVAEFTMTGAVQEALAGPKRPEYFTGFTDVSRAGFRKRAGFDPLAFFDSTSPRFWKIDTLGLKSFYRYRVDVNEATQETLFNALSRMNRTLGRSWELILTIIDNSLHPEFDDLLGFSMTKTVRLVDRYHLTLHVEDPLTEWLRPPDRYSSMGRYYRNLLGDRPFMIDINVVPMMPGRRLNFSTPQPVGTEFLQLWTSAEEHTDRVCFYCESSIPTADWELLPFAMAHGTTSDSNRNRLTIDAPRTVVLREGTRGNSVWLDGHPWPARSDSEIIIPSGKHILEIRPLSERVVSRRLEVRSITGELLHAQWRGNALRLTYESSSRCLIALSRRPARILIDNTPSKLPITHGGSDRILLAPPGRHQVTVD